MKLPLLVSVPHAGLRVPLEAQPYCILTSRQIAEDGDLGAAEIYDIEDHVQGYVTTRVARAIVDQNRAVDDRRKDGVVKTHTCWDVPVYDPFPPENVIDQLLQQYYRPYHDRLEALGRSGRFRLGVDCHTMAEYGPPVGPDPGFERPWVCLSDGNGKTCPKDWMESLHGSFREAFDGPVNVNDPFQGGYITRSHAAEMPWVQLELSRGSFMANEEKRERVLKALSNWCEQLH